MWLFVALTAAAAAQPVVIRADLSATDAARQVGRDSAFDRYTLDPVTLSGLVGGRPPFLDQGGEVIPCGRAPTTAAAVGEAVDHALGRMLQLDYKGALFAVEDALQTVGCQGDRADPDTAAQLYFLRGLMALDFDDPERARDAFEQSIVYAPDRGWDERFPPTGSAVFERARADLSTRAGVSLDVHPRVKDNAILVDGRVISDFPASLAPGEHVVQIEGRSTTTVRIILEPGAESVLVIPGLVEERHAYRVTRPGGAAGVLAVLNPVLEPGADLWVATPTGTWHRTTGDAFELVRARRPRSRRYISANWIIAGSGGVVALVGGTMALLARAEGVAAGEEAAAASSWESFSVAQERHAAAEKRFVPWVIVGASGAAVSLFGATFPLGSTRHTEASP